jgi:hypothetical protein
MNEVLLWDMHKEICSESGKVDREELKERYTEMEPVGLTQRTPARFECQNYLVKLTTVIALHKRVTIGR